MNILVIDDEPLVRIGIKSCLEWSKYDMTVIGEASDGVEAMDMIKLLHPDVMLLDIKMPNMDGLELLKKMKSENIECKAVILSSFDDFYHVKEAMKLGAVDYLHKPCMNPKDILNALTNIKLELETDLYSLNKNNSSVTDLQKNKRAQKELLLREMIDGKITCCPQVEAGLKQNGSRLKNSNISCLVFCIKNLSEVKKRYKESETAVLQASVCNILSEVLSAEDMVEFIQYDNNTFAIITSAEGMVSEKRIHESINSIIYLAADALKQFLNVEIIIGVSNIHASCKELQRAFYEGSKAMKLKFYLGDAHIIHYSAIKHQNEKETLIEVDTMIGKLKSYLAKQDYGEFENILNKLMDFLKKEPILSEEEVKKLSNGLMFILKEEKEGNHDIELINSCESLEQLHDVWKGIIKEKQYENSGITNYGSYSYLVKNIIKFLEENYATEITLNVLSDYFKVSPNYISRLFRQETDINLFHYLNKVRIEKAKKLLMNLDLKIYEVGFKAGFKSTVHFNIVFNKMMCISPKQFRDML